MCPTIIKLPYLTTWSTYDTINTQEAVINKMSFTLLGLSTARHEPRRTRRLPPVIIAIAEHFTKLSEVRLITEEALGSPFHCLNDGWSSKDTEGGWSQKTSELKLVSGK